MTRRRTAVYVIQRGDFDRDTHEYWAGAGWSRDWHKAKRMDRPDAARVARRVGGLAVECIFWTDRGREYCMTMA